MGIAGPGADGASAGDHRRRRVVRRQRRLRPTRSSRAGVHQGGHGSGAHILPRHGALGLRPSTDRDAARPVRDLPRHGTGGRGGNKPRGSAARPSTAAARHREPFVHCDDHRHRADDDRDAGDDVDRTVVDGSSGRALARGPNRHEPERAHDTRRLVFRLRRAGCVGLVTSPRQRRRSDRRGRNCPLHG